MLERIAQKVADYIHEAIRHDVIITDENAVIIGSSNLSRLGQFHKGSTEVLNSGEPNIRTKLEASMIGTKHGITIPIVLSNYIIGTIGLTGPPEEVVKFSILVKRYIELFLREEIHIKTKFLHEQAVQGLMKKICVFQGKEQDYDSLEMEAKELGYDLNKSYVVILFKLKNIDKRKEINFDLLSEFKAVFNNTEDLCTLIDKDTVLLLHLNIYQDVQMNYLKQNILKVESLLNKKGIVITTGVGRTSNNITELGLSYQEAEHSILISHKLNHKATIVNINDVSIENLLLYINKKASSRFINHILMNLRQLADWDELSRTIIAWCETGFSPIDAAQALNIHRNTLFYRIEKINNISKLNLRSFKDSLYLYIAIKIEVMLV